MLDLDALIDAVYRTYKRIEFRKPGLDELEPGTVLGSATWSRRGGTRWVVNPALCLMEGLAVTHMDLARWWVRQNYRIPLRRRRVEDEQGWAPVPLCATSVLCDDAAYVDIRSAYRTVLKAVGWDAEYSRGRYLSLRRDSADVEELTKLAYSAAIAMTARPYTSMRVWTGSTIETRRMRNIYANTSLYRLTRDVLYDIYSDIYHTLGEHLYYYNTDGCIVPARYAGLVQGILAHWGFDSRVKWRGECRVYGVGSYRVSGHQTRRICYRQRQPPPPSSQTEREWLRERFSALARRAA